ncbi:amino acid adenylation domain-containing protein [Ructibacterium gallinarum]|uniref:Amino acid adenylation domain-containing protein n=1 Tax=Ructibacterium gallinarum TaxID=2779355 RepID=A0A9D5M3T0_9FIRM|nr:amino acid adenylation domain-containing protein [Ructibacterium gallinarum]MBE5040169.1 amino acid adenylation domain-containing protein [Ructibacterium gallinarum]
MDTIYSFFQNIVAAYTNQPAIIENGRTMTFGELSDMVDMIACSFPKEIHSIGIVMRHRAEMIASILAVLKCGARYVPAEPDFPTGRIHSMMEEAKVDFILTEHAFTHKLDGFPLRYTDCEICGAETLAWKRNAIADPERPAYVLYTSGTTGRPKGVCVTNRNVCHYVRAFANEFHPGPDDVMLQYSVCSFDIFVEEVFTSLLNGAALAIPSDEDKASTYSLMDFVEKHHVTIISGFPYLLAEMNHLMKIPSSLRLLISGGDVLRGVYVDHLLGQAEVYNTYGPSETTVCASYYRCNGGTVLEDGTYPIGRPVKGAKIRILDQCGKELTDGEIGEICIYGDGVSAGYIGDHDEENKAFEKQQNGIIMYRSGDMGYILPDGNIAFLHRKDNQVMIYGKRVEVSEVESRLYQCRNVQQAIVRAFTDEEGLSYMTAYVVPSGDKLKVSEVKKELSENLTSFMIPEFFVEMPHIPLNVNGKPDVSKLPVVMKAGRYNEN